jgi:hypothetical protein
MLRESVVNPQQNQDSDKSFKDFYDDDEEEKKKSDKRKTKKSGSESKEIKVISATEKVARGKYGQASWVANRKEDGGWKIRSRVKFNAGQKSSVSGKINKFLKTKRVK